MLNPNYTIKSFGFSIRESTRSAFCWWIFALGESLMHKKFPREKLWSQQSFTLKEFTGKGVKILINFVRDDEKVKMHCFWAMEKVFQLPTFGYKFYNDLLSKSHHTPSIPFFLGTFSGIQKCNFVVKSGKTGIWMTSKGTIYKMQFPWEFSHYTPKKNPMQKH